jgi:murein DD-endopeptidase MepM/ murein hydrolase activator NlpD
MHLPIDGHYLTIREKNFKNSFGYGGRKFENGSPKPHQGWDIAAFIGTPVYAIFGGKIEYVQPRRQIFNLKKGKMVEAPYGNEVCLSFEFKGRKLYAQYAHLKSYIVAAGQLVKEGERLGYSGQTGNAEGQSPGEDHLHFEIRTSPHGGGALAGRLDPGTVLGWDPIIDMIFSEIRGAIK